MKILHLTDLHPSVSDPKYKHGLRSAARTSAIVRDCRSQSTGKLRDTIVVISGDLMDVRTDENVKFAQEQIAELRKDFIVIVCPGNHDYYLPDNRKAQVICGNNFWNEFMLPMKSQKNTTRWMTPETEMDYPVRIDVGGDLSFVILDTSAGAQGEKTLGKLGAQQSGRLLERIGFVPPARKLVIVIHHDPVFTGLKGAVGPVINRDPKLVNEDREMLQFALRSRPADLLLCGHTHSPKLHTGSKLSEWSLRAASNGGTSTGHELAGNGRSHSPHLLFDFENLESPEKLKIEWE